MHDSLSRKLLFRWAGWFALANSVVFGLISLRYLNGSVPGETVLGWIYLVSVYVGHHVMLTTVPLFLLATPLILIRPRRGLLTGMAVVLFALMIALMMLDSLLWSESRFHINALTVKILGWPSWVFTGVIFLIGLFFEAMLARGVWNWVTADRPRHGPLLGAACAAMIVLSQGIHAWADASYYVPVTSLGQQLPVYKGVTAKSLLTKSGLVDIEASRERQLARRMSQEFDGSADRLLNYPLDPLQCARGARMNLLLIVADSMRASILEPELTPNLLAFGQRQGMQFRNHFSGGNSSRMGMFSLFYGLPPSYWSSFAALQQPTVLVDEMQRQDYQFGLFSSATLYRPVVLDRTAFANVPDLRIVTEPESDPSWKRDLKLTGEWFEWLDERDRGRPFFGFLFYDATMGRNFPPDYPVQFEPAGEVPLDKEYAKYRTAAHFEDSVIGRVLEDLAKRGLMENTVVMVTADHGEEFGESGPGLEKHGSGYTRHQLQVPMIMHWPGRAKGAVYDHRTSHYDVLPTLMQDLLACSNPASDYSVGANLFEMQEWDWMVAGSYFNYAVLEPDQITITFPSGLYEVRDWDYQRVAKPQFRGEILEAVSEQNARYYRD
ncbi:MAG: DUF3413 domain-containing protein [Xanthomonadales bacterium]|nr:DUF3413 domain-containing protein [Xanthomonadales bacterium]